MVKTYQGGVGWQKQGKRTTVEATPTYSAPTVCLMKVHCIFGPTKDVAEFLTSKIKLARHDGTQSWPGTSVTLRVIEYMTNPTIYPPVRLKVEKTGIDGLVETRDRDDSEFKM